MEQGIQPRVLAIGSLNLDMVLRVDRIPAAGENRMGETYSQLPGGKGGNQAVAAAKFGGNVTFCGCVGADDAGRLLVSSLRQHRIDVSCIAESPVPTGLALIMVEASGQNRIIVYPGANLEISMEQVKRAYAAGAYDAVILNLETSDAVVEAAVVEARQRNIPVVLDAGPARSFDLGKLRGVEILSPNESEAIALTGRDCSSWEGAENAARTLRVATGARYVVMKMGERGALLCDDRGVRRYASIPVKAIDATGAGDAFTSVLAVEYLRTGDIDAAMPAALAAGAITVTRPGAQSAMPDRQEVLAFLRDTSVAVPLG